MYFQMQLSAAFSLNLMLKVRHIASIKIVCRKKMTFKNVPIAAIEPFLIVTILRQLKHIRRNQGVRGAHRQCVGKMPVIACKAAFLCL